ncbi:hypothetical protein J7E91_04460 [Streptomyces sp. ISL-99]|uniref:hypothetical protein n=1 Tax=Streptomyces sp. ISL-99 TaxID=2819193 RepID=UPI001BED04F3|nr:hypothetical protein [Streptomyces sp. ISL-99]MBT2524701.1 hypothetical protein [Streptomyces sp. ISL-99]
MLAPKTNLDSAMVSDIEPLQRERVKEAFQRVPLITEDQHGFRHPCRHRTDSPTKREPGENVQGAAFRKLIKDSVQSEAEQYGYENGDDYADMYGVLCDFYMRTIVHPGELDDSPYRHTSAAARSFSTDLLEGLRKEGFRIMPV